jgi:hypothetical protein
MVATPEDTDATELPDLAHCGGRPKAVAERADRRF